MDSEFYRHSRGCAGPSTESLRHTLLIAIADPTALLCAGERPGVRAFSILSRAGIPSELSSVEAFVDVQYSSGRMRCTAVKHVGRDGPRSSRKSVHSRNQRNQYRIVTSIVLSGLVRHRVPTSGRSHNLVEPCRYCIANRSRRKRFFWTGTSGRMDCANFYDIGDTEQAFPVSTRALQGGTRKRTILGTRCHRAG